MEHSSKDKRGMHAAKPMKLLRTDLGQQETQPHNRPDETGAQRLVLSLRWPVPR